MTKLDRPLVLQTVILAGILLFAAGLFFLPTALSVRTDATTLQHERTKEAIAQEEQKNNLLTERTYDEIRSKAEEIESYFVTEESVLDALGSIETIGNTSGVSITIENYSAPAFGSSVSPFTMKALGSYPSILNFLRSLEQLDVYVSIVDLIFVPDETAGALATFHATLTWRSP